MVVVDQEETFAVGLQEAFGPLEAAEDRVAE